MSLLVNQKQMEKKITSKGIKPLADKVLVREFEKKDRLEKTATGIFLPVNGKEERGAKRGEVIAVGPGRYEEGKNIPMTVHVGDEVLYQWGDTFMIGDIEYTLVSENNLIAVIKA